MADLFMVLLSEIWINGSAKFVYIHTNVDLVFYVGFNYYKLLTANRYLMVNITSFATLVYLQINLYFLAMYYQNEKVI